MNPPPWFLKTEKRSFVRQNISSIVLSCPLYSLIVMKSVLLLGGASLLLASCAITQENPMKIYIPSDLSFTAREELRQEAIKACRVAGYGNISSNILVFSTDVDYEPVSGDIRGIPLRKSSSAHVVNMQMKGNMVVSRSRSYEIPGILIPLLYWTGGTYYVEIPVNILYHEPDESDRKKFRAVWENREWKYWEE